ncbi:hypothetical protein [Paenibacillus cremeus]|uniref:Uncharacterized protein n=1 Tax=Paenibacillus cremeus TaxID=2163881 RepID=A0A559K619_9BACL|nr:hypothetical protein [Paenibacillus cremeus]TVY07588.1 hypothetical protein FPZ49_22850 [Paenibacillus cremeus]
MAPKLSKLGYIQGEGRFAIKDKQLRVKLLPMLQQGSYTPKGDVDRGLTWLDDRQIVVSRSKEQEWSTEPAQRPLPSLVKVDTAVKAPQGQITFSTPPEQWGDYQPQWVRSASRVSWIRTDRKQADVWLARPDGQGAERYIAGIGTGAGSPEPVYYEAWDWSSALAWYDPPVQRSE